jgi:thiol-disulfide isomerase/thioredoxin
MRGLARAILPLCLLAASAGAAAIPRPAPEFVVRGSGGEALLSQFRGKVVLLAFIFTTCPHCQRTVGIMSEVQKEYASRGFQALGSAFNDMAAQLLPAFLTQFHPNFAVGYAARPTVLEFLQTPSNLPLSVPVLVFIDKKGTIRSQHMGSEDPFFKDQERNMRAELEALLKEPAQAKKAVKKVQ